jgi:hypothetical protein
MLFTVPYFIQIQAQNIKVQLAVLGRLVFGLGAFAPYIYDLNLTSELPK